MQVENFTSIPTQIRALDSFFKPLSKTALVYVTVLYLGKAGLKVSALIQ